MESQEEEILTTILTSKEIERKRLLVSKFKEDNLNHIEIQELITILEKEKHIAEEENGEDVGDSILELANETVKRNFLLDKKDMWCRNSDNIAFRLLEYGIMIN